MTDGNKHKPIPVIEIFGPTIQGEGAIAGRVSHFIRTGGCGYKCLWCDSMHAVDAEQVKLNRTMMLPVDIISKIKTFAPAEWVTLTGGDPVMWDLGPLVWGLQSDGFKVTVETQGQLWKSWLSKCDQVTVSPKPPSSGMVGKLKLDLLKQYETVLNGRMSIKIVVFDDIDFEFVRFIRKEFPQVNFFLSAGTPQNRQDEDTKNEILTRYQWLAEKTLKHPELRSASVLPQLHVLLWGTRKGV